MFHLEAVWQIGSVYGMVVLNPIGFRCGYVLLPHGHPWVGREPGMIPASVHGGLTYSGIYPVEHLDNGDGVPEGWWIGFDCAHAFDAPEPEVWEANSGGIPYPVPGRLWSHDDVRAEVMGLAYLVKDARPILGGLEAS